LGGNKIGPTINMETV